jgi:penicillin-binding protein 2
MFSTQYEDKRNLHTRLTALQIGAVVVFSLLAISFWLLQVVQHSKYREMADNNRLRTISLRAPRGVLVDRHGEVLVDNRPSRTIVLDREQTKDIDRTLTRLAEIAGVDEADLREIVQRRRREPTFRPIALIEQATEQQVFAVRARALELPGVLVHEVPTRAYPDRGLAGHLFGYVGEIREDQLDRPEFPGIPPGAIVGQTGLERVYNERLMGRDGSRFVVVNSLGREIDELNEEPPTIGSRLQLTIDGDMQRALEEAFAHYGYYGAAAFLQPRTGEVLAMTSLPTYDPNDFAAGITRAKYSALLTDPRRPFNNRVIQGTFHPGSTFKIVMAIAGLSEGVITPQHTEYCTGAATFYGRPFKCHRAGGHGRVDLRQAIEKSCNVYFYRLGDRMSIDTIHRYASMLGLVGKTGIDLPNEIESLVPSTVWKKRVRNEPWYPGETISVAIGQGAVSVTPIALATMMATVANGGSLVTPHLVRAIDDGRGWTEIPAPAPRRQMTIAPEHLQAVHDGLWMVVNGAGTAPQARIAGKDVAGKTGTAQVLSLEGAKTAAGKIETRDHGWFVFFAPRDNPQVAGVVLAEHSEHGYSAAPIVKHVLETYFAKQEGRPLPVLVKPTPIVASAPNPEPRTPNSEPRTPNSEPRTPNPEPRTGNPNPRNPGTPGTPGTPRTPGGERRQ